MFRISPLGVAICLLFAYPAGGQETPVTWRYTFERPGEDWTKPDFDDSAWNQGAGGFGAGNTPGVKARTNWSGPDIWLRRSVELPEVPADARLRMYHDEDAEAYVNGVPAVKVTGFTKDYELFPLTPEGRAALKKGANLLAVHCRQTRGGQFIDVDIVSAAETSKGAAPGKGPGKAPAGKAKAGPADDRGPVVPLKTRWAKDVTPENAHREYPRPQMVRKDWLNLNGLWDYAIEGESKEWAAGRVENATFDPLDRLTAAGPGRWDGRILVPFCAESSLSGVGKLVRPDQLLWYRRTFEVPAAWAGRRVLLRFEAVDWHAKVWVNGAKVGDHKGGYDPFAFDVTDALADGKDGRHEVVVCVWDPTNMGDQGVGKQALPELRKGFRYTPTTGIWQTVWLEPVPTNSIASLKTAPDVDAGCLRLAAETAAKGLTLRAVARDGQREVGRTEGPAGAELKVPVPDAKLWSPDSPHLYDLDVMLMDGERVVDQVGGYFGMRKISLGKDEAGFTRILLNNKPVFQVGPLDQGFWPDGIHTPPSDEAAAFDVKFLKDIGCNMARVHVKVHPARWYYHCDRLGLLVWQDMVCTRKFDPKITSPSAAQWELEQRRMIDHLHNHPSIILWIVFNEGWGQYDTERLTKWTKDYDPSRLVTNASGWTDFNVGDILDIHDYSFHPSVPVPEAAGGRALLLGECGGFNRLIPGHAWYSRQEEKEKIDYVGEPSRMTFADAARMADGYAYWVEHLRQMRHAQGLNAAVYTQITDVEHELNGWLTYDREVPKFDPAEIRRLHDRLFLPAPKTRAIVPPGDGTTWKHSFGKVAANWFAPGFDDGRWASGKGPFGRPDAAGLPAGTAWGQGDLCMRKAFDLAEVPRQASLRVRMSGPCEVYLNGELIKRLGGGRREDQVCAHDVPLRPETVKLLRKGANVLAVRSSGGKGTKFLDVGLLEVLE